jgi:serine/threonine-protein kinase RsbW
MPEERWKRFPGVLSNIADACDFVVECAQQAGLDERGQYHCRLAVEEACTNVIEHGYQFEAGAGSIEISCTYLPPTSSIALQIVISDEAPPYNPLNSPDPDPNKPLWEREGGGWGVAFIRKVMDEVDYQLHNNRNHLIMVKRG